MPHLYQAYAESHESDPQEISEGFKELENYLCTVPLEDNNAVFNLCCCLCTAYEQKAFLDGLQYGAHLICELGTGDFIARLHIALKECAESEYWLELLIEGGYTDNKVVLDHCEEVKKF